MPTHPDSIGYIRDLGHSEGFPWLEMICDLAASGTTSLSPKYLETLVQLFTKRASYIRQPAPSPITSPAATVETNTERLETIGPFNDFKRLSNSLTASFVKQVTIVFGANGSGKTSVCEALQMLSSTDVPKRPFHDVLATETGTPSFEFKFTSDAITQTWSSPGILGSRANTIKYFDTAIAVHNIKNSVQPGRIIELSPFKLDVFTTAKKHCAELREQLQKIQNENENLMKGIVERISTKFAAFKDTVLADLTSPVDQNLESEILLGESFNDEKGLANKLKNKEELEKATSADGLKLLKSEVAALKSIRSEMSPLLSACEDLIKIDPLSQFKSLKAKEEELEILAKALIPSGSTMEKLLALIRPANDVCNLHSPESGKCPLCRQVLHESELDLFEQYSALLTDDLNASIFELREEQKDTEEYFKVVANSTPSDWEIDSVLPLKQSGIIKNAGKTIQDNFKTGLEITQEGKDAVTLLRDFINTVAVDLEKKNKLIGQAEKEKEKLSEELREISAECHSLLYAKEISENIDLVKEVHALKQNADFWAEYLPDFTKVLRKITSTAKTAHKELVVDDFKTRLNAEYLALAEKGMSSFGVELKDIGGDGAVTVDHHIAGQKIDLVLSEGEQRIHALALFFAELETSDQQVIVFDDPISSFDYNYIGNYCNRLRDFILAHPNRQIIVLTHNWEFFVQIQSTLNKARLNNHMAVHVLENCVAIDEYSENISNLKADVESNLAIVGEPTKQQKEIMAGKMRRLIEAIVNTHVFNNQRHQYKQKNQPVSVFNEFTKVVALLPSEAQSLRDLFEKLSITEHDDPRNAYVNTDKATFQTRFNIIKNIEIAIIGRK